MNIDKVRKYNQVLLAVSGTTIAIFLIVILLMEVSRTYSYDSFDNEGGLLSSEVTEELLQDSLTKQILSVNYIRLIDSISSKYVIPITQADIESGQKIGELLGLINSFDGSGNDYRYRVAINNLVIYSSLDKESVVLFNERIGITDYQVSIIKGKSILWILGATLDSNKDGRINSSDIQEMYIYSVDDGVIRKIDSPEDYTAIDLVSNSNTNDIFIKYGFDLNNDGYYNSNNEPANIYLLDLGNYKLVDLISKDQFINLQKYIQGAGD